MTYAAAGDTTAGRNGRRLAPLTGVPFLDVALDDDTDCPEHAWRLVGVALIPGHGAPTEYECDRCSAVLYRSPDDPFPGTV